VQAFLVSIAQLDLRSLASGPMLFSFLHSWHLFQSSYVNSLESATVSQGYFPMPLQLPCSCNLPYRNIQKLSLHSCWQALLVACDSVLSNSMSGCCCACRLQERFLLQPPRRLLGVPTGLCMPRGLRNWHCQWPASHQYWPKAVLPGPY
jgi:hypothetical protein